MSTAANSGTHEALQAYLDDLLGSPEVGQLPVTIAPVPVTPEQTPSALPRYHLLCAGGVKVALAAARVAVGMDADQDQAADRQWLDLGSVLRGAPVTVAVPVVAIPLAASPTWGLSVESCEAVVEVADAAVTWRDPRGSRRWLAGLIEAHGAVIVDPAVLIEEAEEHGIQSAV